MKKILISKENMSKIYGASANVYEQIDFFKDQGHKVYVCSEQIDSERIKKEGALPHKTIKWPWNKKHKRRISYSKQTIKFGKKIKSDLVIGHGDLQFQDVLCLHNCVHLAHERVFSSPLSQDDQMYKTHTPILKNKQFKHIVANSQLMKNDLISRFNIKPEDITVIYPSMYNNQFKKFDSSKKLELKAKFGFDRDTLLVGLITSGNFKKRGVDEFIKSIDFLSKEVASKTKFIIVGKDKLDDEMQTLLESSKYSRNIQLLPVIDAVEEYYNVLDLFVLPARIEEFGRVIAEACACGTPIVTTKWVGASEILDGKSQELVYDGDSPKALSEIIERVLSDQSLRDELSILNQNSAKKVFREEIFKQFAEVYKNFL